MLLAKQLWTEEEKSIVREEIEKQIKDINDLYSQSVARLILERFSVHGAGWDFPEAQVDTVHCPCKVHVLQ